MRGIVRGGTPAVSRNPSLTHLQRVTQGMRAHQAANDSSSSRDRNRTRLQTMTGMTR